MTPTGSPCDPDRPLDVASVERTLHAQFPELVPVRAEWFASGCCNEVYRVNSDWLFRFPKRVGLARTVESGIWLAEVVDQRNELGIVSRLYTFEQIIGPTLRSMVRRRAA